MRIRQALFFLLFLAVIFIYSPLSYGKGSPDKIVITGANRSVAITDREVLKNFDPWRAQFIDWSKGNVTPKDTSGLSYEVFFYMKWTGRRSDYDLGELKLVYTLRYIPSRDGSPGYVYLPGPTEKFYYVNVGTILREQYDGRWHEASAEWDAMMKRLITDRGDHHPTVPSSLLASFFALMIGLPGV